MFVTVIRAVAPWTLTKFAIPPPNELPGEPVPVVVFPVMELREIVVVDVAPLA